ncbi:unnamed protein product [Orchesella dallaii]|uniref:DNA-directed RNA polymerase III subunit n=1 Tax=Orchesella dallaii TaxID=48710 RepID=A0ABP1R347_9HEXA
MATNNETKSVSLIIKQRQQSRSATVAPKPGAKGGGGPGALNQSLNPVLPPLYPAAPKPASLIPEVANTVKVYNKLCQYFRSNFSIEYVRKDNSGFYVERYTDQYKSPLALETHLLHMLPDSKFPEEIGTKHVPRKTVVQRQKRKLEDLPDTDDAENAASGKSAPKIKQEPVSDEEEEEKEEANFEDDELEDDVDPEMDLGTDYAMSYFDNGEGDDDDRDEEDGTTY